MSSPFVPAKPVRIRFESSGKSFDEVVQCAIVIRPTPDGQSVQCSTHHQTVEQLTVLFANAIKFAHDLGVLPGALSLLLGPPGGAQQLHQEPPPGSVPPDDIPPHLRKS